jgi:hypothetical protein
MSETAKHTEVGQTKLGMLTTVLFFAVAAYAGSQVFPFYYYAEEFKGLMESQASKAQVFTDDQIRRELSKKIKELDLPLDAEEIKINRFNDKIIIEAQYEEVLFIDLGEDRVYDLYTFKFHPRVERNI